MAWSRICGLTALGVLSLIISIVVHEPEQFFDRLTKTTGLLLLWLLTLIGAVDVLRGWFNGNGPFGK
jgi:hypothetical protein